MKYQKIINLLENTPNQPSRFGAKIWVVVNGDSRGTYKTNSQIKFKTSMLMSSLCDYNDAYKLMKGTITATNTAAAALNNVDKKIIFQNCAPFTNSVIDKQYTSS